MKKNLLIWGAILLLSVGGCLGYYHFATADTALMLCGTDGEMEWLRQEFKLTEDQFQKIKALHAAYRPKCDRMCEKIAEARPQLDSLITTNQTMTPEVASAFQAYASLEEECQLAMLGHIYEVSAVMTEENGRRYVQMMKAHILQPHTDSRAGMQMNPSH